MRLRLGKMVGAWIVTWRIPVVATLMLVVLAISEPVRDGLAVIGNAPPVNGLMHAMAVAGLAPVLEKRVTIIDIDEDTWLDWKRPPLTPRAKLAAILDRLAPHRPEAVIIDVDVSRVEAGDSELREAIIRATPEAAPLRLLMPREIRGTGSDTTEYPTAFDALGGIAWVSVRFLADDARVVNRWRLWEPVCRPEPTAGPPSGSMEGRGASPAPVARPSPQLYLTMLSPLRSHAGGESWQRYDLAAAALCAGKKELPDGLMSDKPARMAFAFGDVSGALLPALTVRQNGAAAPAVFRVSARTFLEKQIAPSLLRDRVVIVGSSHPDSGDIHMTPYGAMPGMMILANAIAMGPAIIARPGMGALETAAYSVALAVIAALIYLRFRFFFFFLFNASVAIGFYIVIAAFYQPSAAAEVLTSAMAILAAILGLESLWQTGAAWWRGCGLRSILKGNET